MKTALQIDITYEQILSIVRQLPVKQKIELSKELEKDDREAKASDLLNIFETEELDLLVVNKDDSMIKAADALLSDYQTDEELTIFTNLDFENFYEAR